MKPRIAITAGEPAGIGPDLIIMLAQQSHAFDLVAIADPQLLLDRAAELNLPLRIQDASGDDGASLREAGSAALSPESNSTPGSLSVVPVACKYRPVAGRLDAGNAHYVLNTLDIAIDGCLQGRFHAMVTAPLHKGVINDAGIPFTGHTEYLAERTAADPVMMLACETAKGPLRVALATTHLPLASVPEQLTRTVLERALRIVHRELRTRFGIDQPRILVAGLNPHAGEGGHLGREEITIIEPAVNKLRQESMNLTGPLPADTLFTHHHLVDADAVMAMYHDQGLPVLKYAGFGDAVNITLGLPIIRTSVDHGTALDKAGTGNIESGSLNAALTEAVRQAKRQAEWLARQT